MKTLSTPPPNLVEGPNPLAKGFTRGKKVAVASSFLLLSSCGFILASEIIDLNTASFEDLQKIKWVGQVIAQRIIDARPFYSVDDLIKVDGIGEKRLADIKEQGLAWVNPNMQPPTPLSPPPTPLAPPPAAAPAKIDLNAASAQELQKLSGVGEALAQRIIDARPFYSVDELLKVRGIGEKTLAAIEAQGLAWVDPSLKPLKIEDEQNLTETGLAQISETFPQQFQKENTKNKAKIFVIALLIAVLSSGGIFFLKNKLKRYKNL